MTYAAARLWIPALFALSSAAFAHTDAALDQQPAPHGGQVRMAGPYHLELARDPNGLRVYVTDHAGTPQDVGGMSGRVIVLSGDTIVRLVLRPVDEHSLLATGDVPVAVDAKAVVSIRTATGSRYQARFAPARSLGSPSPAVKK